MKLAHSLRLPLLMLGVAGLGVVAGVVRATALDSQELGRSLPSLAIALPVMLAPVGVLAAFAVWLQRRNRIEAVWGGVAGAVGAAIYSFVLLRPELNRDANIGLSLYWMFGWFYPLGLVFALGAALGGLAERWRGLPPSPAALEDAARQLPPLRLWLWPLVVPGATIIAVQFAPLLPGGVGVYRDEVPRFVLVQSFFLLLGSLPLALSPALIALLALRGRAAHDGRLRPRLAAFWGLCLGLAVTLWLFGFGLSVLPRLPLEIVLLLCAVPPILGYAVGRWWGTHRKSAGAEG
ncbi:DUF3995 domain-containing protein [Deinococcus saxicola]|uniref:hypothetical protein n=1 Tax=Deinococcus saxicola TaxID=249406 RepID=UPI0039F039BE